MGEKLKGTSQAVSWEYLLALLRVALEHGTLSFCIHHNPLNLCTEPILWVSFHSFESPDASHGTHCIVLVHVMFIAVPQCSREVSASRVNHPKYLASKPVSVHDFELPITSPCLFRVVDGGYIKALPRRVYSCRLQQIIQELDLETI